jgi:hypothetical protein
MMIMKMIMLSRSTLSRSTTRRKPIRHLHANSRRISASSFALFFLICLLHSSLRYIDISNNNIHNIILWTPRRRNNLLTEAFDTQQQIITRTQKMQCTGSRRHNLKRHPSLLSLTQMQATTATSSSSEDDYYNNGRSYSQEDINAAWRFASLHGSSIRNHIFSGESHHPLTMSTNEYTTSVTLQQQQQSLHYPQHDPTNENAWSTTHMDSSNDDDASTFFTASPQQQQMQQQQQQQQQQYSLPKLYQGIYQLSNEEEYR